MSYKDLVGELRSPKILDAKAGHTRPASDLEVRAASAIESLEFQLASRLGKLKPGEMEEKPA